MAKKQRDYWSREAIMATGADYMIIFGQNCAGKSYQAKEEAIQRAIKGERFFYLRRMVTEVNQNKATLYFSDMPVNTTYRNYTVRFCINYKLNPGLDIPAFSSSPIIMFIF